MPFWPDKPPEHFWGSLVVIESGMTDGVIPVFTLVDGQQRLTTISLLLNGLYEYVAKRATYPQLMNRIRRMLVNDVDAQRDVYLKILPTTKYGDRMVYQRLIEGKGIAENDATLSSKIYQAYAFLRREVERQIAAGRIEPERFYRVIITCFQVVFINLSQDESPYRIFESLNGKGKPLTQADLVRNYIAMRLPVRQQESVFRSDWQHIEERLQEQREVGRIGELTAFIRHYLAMHSFILSNEEHVYARFRDRMERECPTVDAFITEIATLRRFAGYYDRFLRPEHEPRPAVRQRLTRLGILETSTSYPFLMRLFDAADAGSLSECDLVSALDIIENYFVRRYLIGETQYVNRMFPTLCRDIQHYDATLPATLRALLATKRCPTDDEVRAAARKRPLYVQSRTYSSIRLRALLTRINEHLSRDCDAVTVLQGTPTIEHILPQTLTDAWRRDLGDAAEQILHDYGDTLGNLTLVTQCYNSQLSNRSFAEKARELAHHGLKLNDVYFADPPALWNAVAIQQRADFLVDQILAIWPSLGSDYMKRAEWQTGAKPKLLIIRDEVIPVKLWRDIIYQTAEYCIRQGAFEAVAQAVPKLVSAEKIDGKYPKDWTVLSNHWSVKVNMSREQVKSVCRRIFSAIGVSENEWHIEEESVESTSGM